MRITVNTELLNAFHKNQDVFEQLGMKCTVIEQSFKFYFLLRLLNTLQKANNERPEVETVVLQTDETNIFCLRLRHEVTVLKAGRTTCHINNIPQTQHVT